MKFYPITLVVRNLNFHFTENYYYYLVNIKFIIKFIVLFFKDDNFIGFKDLISLVNILDIFSVI